MLLIGEYDVALAGAGRAATSIRYGENLIIVRGGDVQSIVQLIVGKASGTHHDRRGIGSLSVAGGDLCLAVYSYLRVAYGNIQPRYGGAQDVADEDLGLRSLVMDGQIPWAVQEI